MSHLAPSLISFMLLSLKFVYLYLFGNLHTKQVMLLHSALFGSLKLGANCTACQKLFISTTSVSKKANISFSKCFYLEHFLLSFLFMLLKLNAVAPII